MPNRTLCDILNEMRTCHKLSNYSYLLSLVEEAQMLGNRMEAALWDQKDIERVAKDAKDKKVIAAIDKLRISRREKGSK